MNTVTAMSKTNSLEQDQTVNQDQKQFTSPEVDKKPQGTAFVSQFDTSPSAKKENKTAKVKISTSDVHVYYGQAEAIKGIDLNIYEN